MAATLILVLVAYLIGAVPFGLLVARFYGVPDIRKVGSGNTGATNVYRTSGPGAAAWVFLLDIGKGVLPVLLARQLSPGWWPQDVFLLAVAMAAVIGHIFPVYLKFRGGKGVNTALGGLLVIMPLEMLGCLVVFAIMTALFRYISLGSISAALCLPATLLGEHYLLDNRQVPEVYLYFGTAVALLVILTHVRNIGRLIAGTE
ncbi:MAG: glycerol-3-phosphate 1-O-acyltransferase PlsY, partial [bacterium]|nr:glycerol-3-phosphate 1-O-acyltransferase PlsY [bacterium]